MRTTQQFVTGAGPDTVWQILADVEHWCDWTPTVRKIEPLDGGGLRTGARYRVVQPGLQPCIYEVTECVPGENFTWAYKLPGSQLVAGHQIGKSNGQTEVELSFESQGFLAGVLALVLSKTIRKLVATEAISLKQKCELV